MTAQEPSLVDFSRVYVKSAIEVDITQSGTYSVSVVVENFDARNVSLVREADKLVISRRRTFKSLLAAPVARIKVNISMPELAELDLSGASRGTVTGFASDSSMTAALSGASMLTLNNISAGEFKGDISGASRLKGQLVAAQGAEMKVRGASTVELTGSAPRLVIDASGASRFELAAFPTHDAEVNAQGASSGTISLDGTLNARLGGASRLLYAGKPALGRISVSGASTIGEAK